MISIYICIRLVEIYFTSCPAHVGLIGRVGRGLEGKSIFTMMRYKQHDQQHLMFAKSQVSFAVSSLAEEKARAADREALLREMLLTERDKEDR